MPKLNDHPVTRQQLIGYGLEPAFACKTSGAPAGKCGVVDDGDGGVKRVVEVLSPTLRPRRCSAAAARRHGAVAAEMDDGDAGGVRMMGIAHGE